MTAEMLLRHDRFLRTLARELVSDEASAEDAVHGVYAIALACTSREPRALHAARAGRKSWWRAAPAGHHRARRSDPAMRTFLTAHPDGTIESGDFFDGQPALSNDLLEPGDYLFHFELEGCAPVDRAATLLPGLIADVDIALARS